MNKNNFFKPFPIRMNPDKIEHVALARWKNTSPGNSDIDDDGDSVRVRGSETVNLAGAKNNRRVFLYVQLQIWLWSYTSSSHISQKLWR